MGHFRVAASLCLKCEVKCESTDMKMIFLFTTYFNKKRFCSWPWFEKEGFWNSEMALYRWSHAISRTYCKMSWTPS